MAKNAPKPDAALLTRKPGLPLSWEALLVIILVLSLAAGRVLSPVFLTGANLSNVLADLTEVALMALPMTLIIVAAEIDLSVASVLGASSALLGVLWHMGLPMPVAMALVLGVISIALVVLHVSPFWEQAIQGALIVAAIAADTLLARSVAKRMMRKRDHG